jgi:hypothetical protein
MHVSTCSQNSSMIIMIELWQLWRPWGGNQYATVGVEGILHAVLQRVRLALSKALSKSIPCIQCIPCADKVESKWSQTFLQILLICSLIRLKRLWRTATTWRNVTHEEMWRNVTCDGMWRVRLFFFIKHMALRQNQNLPKGSSHTCHNGTQDLVLGTSGASNNDDLSVVAPRCGESRGIPEPSGIDALASRPHLQGQWRGYVGCYPCRRLPWPSSCKPQIPKTTSHLSCIAACWCHKPNIVKHR